MWVRRFHGFCVLCLLALCSLAALLAVQQSRLGWRLESDLQALLPPVPHQEMADQAATRLGQRFGNQLVLGVRGDSREAVLAAVPAVEAALADSGLSLAPVTADAGLSSPGKALLQAHRFTLLTREQRQWLQAGNLQPLRQRGAAAIMGLGATGALSPLEDPLALFADYRQQWLPTLPGELHGDQWLLPGDDSTLLVWVLTLGEDALELAVHDRLNAMVASLEAALARPPLNGKVSLLRSGMAFHAAAASGQARQEAMFIGVGSCAGILLLFLLVFRRFWPLWLSLGSVALGCGLAFVFNHAWFGSFHVISLVFGAGLIGVAVDYSLHFLCLRQDQAGLSGREVLGRIMPALILALITSMLGYACLYQARADALQQIASFSLVGLLGAWLFVVAAYPLLARGVLPPPVALMQRGAARIFSLLPRSGGGRGLVALVVTVVSAVGLARLETSNDVRALYRPGQALAASEQLLQSRLQMPSASQFFLVEAPDPQTLLEREEAFRETLDALTDKGVLEDYLAVSTLLPSRQRQQQNYALQHATLYDDHGMVPAFMRQVGFAPASVDALLGAFRQGGEPLSVDEGVPLLPLAYRALWLGQWQDRYVSVIALRGIHDGEALAAASQHQPGVHWQNRVAAMSLALDDLARSSALLLGLAYLVVMGLLVVSMRQWSAAALVLVPFMATLLSLSLLSLSGVALGVFHVFACYLILGLGMDYGIFVRHAGADDPACQRAVVASVFTSALSFGLLAFSSTPMIQAFGATLLLGALFNGVLAPLNSRAVSDHG